jgi:hypothetical protein
MLVGAAADVATVLSRALATMSTVFCVLVLISFGLFARDQMAVGSQHQQTAELPNAAALANTSPRVPHQRAQPRRFIDGAASALTSPFRSIVQSNNDWVDHGVPTVLALLVYGAGLGYLARFSRGFA